MLKFRIFHTHGFVVVAGRAGQPSGSLSGCLLSGARGKSTARRAPKQFAEIQQIYPKICQKRAAISGLIRCVDSRERTIGPS